MFFNTEGDAIRTIISNYESSTGVQIDFFNLLVYCLAWYFFTCVTYGVWVPAGLFLPGMILGCAVGGLYADFQRWLFGISALEEYTNQNAVAFVCVAAGAMLAGYTRLTYSLVVIMLETTSSLNIFIPMLFGILVSRQVGMIFTDGLYDRAIRAK